MPRWHHSAARLGHSMIVYGGLDPSSLTLGCLFEFHLKDKIWARPSFLTSVRPPARSHSTLTPVYSSRSLSLSRGDIYSIHISSHSDISTPGMYLFGGKNSEGKALNDVWALSAYKNKLKWTLLCPRGDVPSPRYSHTSIFITSLLFIYGGRDDSLYKDYDRLSVTDIGVLDAENMNWRSCKLFGDGMESRFCHSAVGFERKIIIFGGMNGCSLKNAGVWVLETDNNSVRNLLSADEERKDEKRLRTKRALTKKPSLLASNG